MSSIHNFVRLTIQEIRTWEVYAKRPEGQDQSKQDLSDHYTQHLYENEGVERLLGDAPRIEYSAKPKIHDYSDDPATRIYLTADLTQKTTLGVTFSEAVRVCSSVTDGKVEFALPNGKRMVGLSGDVKFYNQDGNYVDLGTEDFTSDQWTQVPYHTARSKIFDI